MLPTHNNSIPPPPPSSSTSKSQQRNQIDSIHTYIHTYTHTTNQPTSVLIPLSKINLLLTQKNKKKKKKKLTILITPYLLTPLNLLHSTRTPLHSTPLHSTPLHSTIQQQHHPRKVKAPHPARNLASSPPHPVSFYLIYFLHHTSSKKGEGDRSCMFSQSAEYISRFVFWTQASLQELAGILR